MEMMTGRTLFRNYKEYDQKEVEICGWVKSNRGSKKFGFLVINDGTFLNRFRLYMIRRWVTLIRSAN